MLMLVHYKCPNCGDDMAFDADSGKLSCPSCGHGENIELLDEEYISREFSEDDAQEYHCKNCGAVVLTDKDTTATSCSFCGAGVVLADRLTNKLAPVKIIPFSISKELAQESFKKWCKNGRFTPKGFMTADRIKNITGIYVPFWIYDLHSDIHIRALGTRVKSYRRGDYVYVETKYYDVEREIVMYHEKVPADASKKMDDSTMDLVEPYNYRDLKEFKMAYLTGFLAEKYNFTANDLLPRAKRKISRYINSYVNSTMRGYTSLSVKNKDIHTVQKKGSYVLFPLWMVYYDYEQQEHTFAMNGQTGKVVGTPPISKGKVVQWFAGLSASLFILFKIIAFLIGGVWW